MCHGVAHQVAEDLPEAGFVAKHDGWLAAGQHLQPDLAVGPGSGCVVHGVGSEGNQLDRAPFDRSLLIEAGQQEKVVDEQPHPRRLILYALH